MHLRCHADSILSLKTSKSKDSRTFITLVDYYNILSYILKDLSLAYKTEVTKDIFPYTFTSNNTLAYQGEKLYFYHLNK